MKKELNAKALGLAIGSLWAASLVVFGLIANLRTNWMHGIDMIGLFYPGYGPGVGLLFGAIWGFLDGLVGGYLVAWLYNKFAR